jgi:hypothetical protein
LGCERSALPRRNGRTVVRECRLRPARNCRCRCRSNEAASLLSVDSFAPPWRSTGQPPRGVAARRTGPHLLRQQWVRSCGNSPENRPPMCPPDVPRRKSLQGDRPPPGLSRLHDGGDVGNRSGRAQAGVRTTRARLPACSSTGPLSVRSLLAGRPVYAGLARTSSSVPFASRVRHRWPR